VGIGSCVCITRRWLRGLVGGPWGGCSFFLNCMEYQAVLPLKPRRAIVQNGGYGLGVEIGYTQNVAFTSSCAIQHDLGAEKGLYNPKKLKKKWAVFCPSIP